MPTSYKNEYVHKLQKLEIIILKVIKGYTNIDKFSLPSVISLIKPYCFYPQLIIGMSSVQLE